MSETPSNGLLDIPRCSSFLCPRPTAPLPSSPLNLANFLDISDLGAFSRAFIDGKYRWWRLRTGAHVRLHPVSSAALVQWGVHGRRGDADQ